ncbi:MAG: formamidopyrimidine DNA glycosylase [Polyangia bacterium]
MPEGDTIHKHAADFRAGFVGRRVEHVRRGGVVEPLLSGAELVSADATGKNLSLRFIRDGVDGAAIVVRVHLGIAGTWRTGPKSRFKTMSRAASPLELDFGERVAFVYRPSEVRVERESFTKPLSHLGPDLLGEEPDWSDVLRRAREPIHADRPLGELLLDQRVSAGIGNVYKSELCFLEKLHPFLRVDEVGDDKLLAIFQLARRLLFTNLGDWRRTTTADRSRGELPTRGKGRHWVYGRQGRACYDCGTLIQRKAMGPDLRAAFWCPRCQAP